MSFAPASKFLFVGDIVGRPGRELLKEKLRSWREKFCIEVVVANAENAAGGRGLTVAIAHDLRSYGIDLITLGNHVWDQKGFDREIDSLDFVCRPANLPSMAPGRTHLILTAPNGWKLGVFTVIGDHNMDVATGMSALMCIEAKVTELRPQVDALIVEIHAELAGEKSAYGWALDGRVTVVLGTHTHTQTADARVLPKGTAYVTDVGMTGPYNSVLGMNPAMVIAKAQDGLPRRMEVASGPSHMCACLVEFDRTTGLAKSIQALQLQ
jgi:2',3'-cyclic-nucleotide 2'-phosphodiesterase